MNKILFITLLLIQLAGCAIPVGGKLIVGAKNIVPNSTTNTPPAK
jgi:hypothetical protein